MAVHVRMKDDALFDNLPIRILSNYLAHPEGIEVTSPNFYRLIIADTRKIGFQAWCSPPVGALLRVMAALKPGGRPLEIGTGTGLGTCWLLDGMDAAIANAPKQGLAWMLSLDSRWLRCTVWHSGGSLWIPDAKGGIRAGMSGSPLLSDDGSAIGIVCTNGGTGGLGSAAY